ncbi:unnamed protein product [Paramecium primaurelia]|uniref:Cyclic nucleotide-binding domain-containing protein n=1 Tax=Paramecium primaurelia TaxID=5886 RepID=A0A8S1JZT3_PARPR|nr:unnamed protein product [Paramecium primaurelia]
MNPILQPPRYLKQIAPSQFRSLNQLNIRHEEIEEKGFMTKYVQILKKNANGQVITTAKIVNILKLHQLLRNQDQLETLKKYFEDHFPYIGKFKDKLDGNKCLDIFRFMTVEKYKALNIIFRQGEPGRKMYFLLSGEVGIFVPKSNQSQEIQNLICHDFKDIQEIQFQEFRLVAIKKFGDVFGEIAIEQRVTRTATVIAKTDVFVAQLSYEMYQDVIGKHQNELTAQKLQFINTIPLFQDWEQKQKLIALSSFEQNTITCGQSIFQTGYLDEYIYLVVSGEVEIIKFNKVQSSLSQNQIKKIQIIAIINSGQFFGDYEHINNIPNRITSAKARMETVYYKIKYNLFIDLLEMYSNVEEYKKAQMIKFNIQQSLINNGQNWQSENQDEQLSLNIDLSQLKNNYFKNQKIERLKNQLKKQIFKTDDQIKKDYFKEQLKTVSQSLSVFETIQLKKYSNLIPHKHDFFVNEQNCISSPNHTRSQKFFSKVFEQNQEQKEKKKQNTNKFIDNQIKYHLNKKFKGIYRKHTKSYNVKLEQSDSISYSKIIQSKVAKLNLTKSYEKMQRATSEDAFKQEERTPHTHLSLHIRSYHKENLTTNRSILFRTNRISSKKPDTKEFKFQKMIQF